MVLNEITDDRGEDDIAMLFSVAPDDFSVYRAHIHLVLFINNPRRRRPPCLSFSLIVIVYYSLARETSQSTEIARISLSGLILSRYSYVRFGLASLVYRYDYRSLD
jgi:hypothetical protein